MQLTKNSSPESPDSFKSGIEDYTLMICEDDNKLVVGKQHYVNRGYLVKNLQDFSHNKIDISPNQILEATFCVNDEPVGISFYIHLLGQLVKKGVHYFMWASHSGDYKITLSTEHEMRILSVFDKCDISHHHKIDSEIVEEMESRLPCGKKKRRKLCPKETNPEIVRTRKTRTYIILPPEMINRAYDILNQQPEKRIRNLSSDHFDETKVKSFKPEEFFSFNQTPTTPNFFGNDQFFPEPLEELPLNQQCCPYGNDCSLFALGSQCHLQEYSHFQ